MKHLDVRVFIAKHREMSLALIDRIITLYNQQLINDTNHLSFYVTDSIDSGIRTYVVLENTLTVQNTPTVTVIIITVGPRGRLVHIWTDGVLRSTEQGSVPFDELIQSMHEIQFTDKYIQDNNAFPVGFYGAYTVVNYLLDQDKVRLLDEQDQPLLSE